MRRQEESNLDRMSSRQFSKLAGPTLSTVSRWLLPFRADVALVLQEQGCCVSQVAVVSERVELSCRAYETRVLPLNELTICSGWESNPVLSLTKGGLDLRATGAYISYPTHAARFIQIQRNFWRAGFLATRSS